MQLLPCSHWVKCQIQYPEKMTDPMHTYGTQAPYPWEDRAFQPQVYAHLSLTLGKALVELASATARNEGKGAQI
jgi:hypothetical protein